MTLTVENKTGNRNDNDKNHRDMTNDNNGGGGVKLKQQISLLNGCALIIGVVVGAGIFVSPKGVIQQTGSVGLSLIIWLLCGLFATLGALSYAELGTSIPKSGGDYAYINEAFGHLPAFLYLWVALMIINPTSNAILALNLANYILKPFYPDCFVPDVAVRLLAACAICLLTMLNCYDVKLATRAQNLFTTAKIVPLIVVICAGLTWHFLGHSDNLEPSELFDDSRWDLGHIALSFYSGVYSYAGWNYLNFVTEEMKQPTKNLPRAIYISLPLVTVIYLLTNIAYFSVLSPEQVLDSDAVAVTFSNKVLGYLAYLTPVCVAVSCVGSLNAVIFTSSRMFFVGARDGQLPELLSMINMKFVTPLPSLLIMGSLSVVMLISSDIITLIKYLSFADITVVGMSVAGLLLMRITRPDMHRPIKMNICIPITFLLMCTFVVVFPFFREPREVLVGLFMIISGLPIYFIFVFWQNKPPCIYNQWIKFTHLIQKLLWCVPAGNEGKTL